METRKPNYESPHVEVLEIEIEQAVLLNASNSTEGFDEGTGNL